MRYTGPLRAEFAPSLFRKIAEVQGELKGISPDAEVKTEKYSYKYISESALLTQIRDKLSARGVAAFVSVERQNTRMVTVEKSGRNGTYSATHMQAEVEILLTFADGESGEMFSVVGQGHANDSGDKAVYKAITSANRYAWWKTMLIPTDEDDVNQVRGDEARGYANPAAAPAAAPAAQAILPASAPKKPSAAQKQLYRNLLEQLKGLAPARDWDDTITSWTLDRFGGRGIAELTSAEYDVVCGKLEKSRDTLVEQGQVVGSVGPTAAEEAEAVEAAGLPAEEPADFPGPIAESA